MGRELKVKAWLKDAQCFVEVRHISFFEGNTVIKICDQPMSEEIWFDLEELELLQCTGLKDKNGVEIYEGDILKLPTFNNQGWYNQAVVYFEDGAFRCDHFIVRDYNLKHVEVIGNIYENPELVEEVQQ